MLYLIQICLHCVPAFEPIPNLEQEACLESLQSDKVDQRVEETVGSFDQVGRDG